MRLSLTVALIGTAALAAWLAIDFAGVADWALAQQRWFQNEMASALRGLRAGDAAAYGPLQTAAGAYGFVHAVGPGHGKYLIGGVGLGTSVSIPRLMSISIASSVAQALWAVFLVYGGFFLLEASARSMTTLAEDILAPASYAAIGAVGLILAVRGVRSFLRRRASSHARRDHAHDEPCGCGSHHHPPTEALSSLKSFREIAALIAGIAVRPCTGAAFLLVIGWQLDIKMAAAIAVIVMGLGTAALTSVVALSSVAARSDAFALMTVGGASVAAFQWLQIVAGAAIMAFSFSLLGLGPLFP